MQRRLTDFFNSSSLCLNDSIYLGKLTLLNSLPLSNNSNNLSLVRRKRKSKLKSENQLHQTIIDAGQKKIGLQHCSKVPIVYMLNIKY